MTAPGTGVTERVAAVTIAKWTKKVSDLAVQKFAFSKMLEAKKRIKFGCGGGEIRWPVRYRDHEITGYVDMASKNFQRVNTLKNAVLEHRGYEATEAISLKEKLQNGGDNDATIVKIFKNREKDVRTGLMRALGKRWHADGDSTVGTAERRFHGILSFSSTTGQSASDKYATTPNDTYAGHGTGYTSLQASAVSGDAEYGAWSPTIVNCNRNPGSGTRAWDTYADEYIRSGIIGASFGAMQEDNLDMILLNKSAYEDLCNVADDKERLNFKRGEGVGMVKMGFTQFMELDGCQIGWDFGVPAATEGGTVVHGFGYNFDRLELQMLNKSQIWEVIPDWNSTQAADLLYFYSLGNLKFESPKFHALFLEISS